MLIAVLVIIAIAVGLAAGGSLRSFEHVTIHWWGVALAGLMLQVLPAPVVAGRGLGSAMLAASYVLLAMFLWVNRRLPAVPLMLVGVVLNIVVILPNGGMPVSASALQASGGSAAVLDVATGKHHLMTDQDVLRPLADVIPVRAPIGIVISVGDILLYLGTAILLVMITLGHAGENRRPPARWLQGYRGKHLPRERRFPRQARALPPRSLAAAGPPGSAR